MVLNASFASQPSAPDPSGVRIWGTKGIAFWALLSSVLIKARPTSLLEFGGGRSTTFLGDYAFRHDAPFVSIEQSRIWYEKAVADLTFMDVRGDYVHHVPLADEGELPWYDLPRVRDLIGGRTFDLVFVDGPSGHARQDADGCAAIAAASTGARLILVDDVHRSYNNDFFEALAARFPSDGIFYYRYGKNFLGIAVDEWRPIVRSTFDFLGLDYVSRLPERRSR